MWLLLGFMFLALILGLTVDRMGGRVLGIICAAALAMTAIYYAFPRMM